jgi:hypothetical protein
MPEYQFLNEQRGLYDAQSNQVEAWKAAHVEAMRCREMFRYASRRVAFLHGPQSLEFRGIPLPLATKGGFDLGRGDRSPAASVVKDPHFQAVDDQ